MPVPNCGRGEAGRLTTRYSGAHETGRIAGERRRKEEAGAYLSQLISVCWGRVGILAALVEVSIAAQSRDPRRRERGGGAPPPRPGEGLGENGPPGWCAGLRFRFRGGLGNNSSYSSAARKESMCSSPPLPRRRQWHPGWVLLGRVASFAKLSFLSPKENRVVVVGLRREARLLSLFSGEICGVVVAT